MSNIIINSIKRCKSSVESFYGPLKKPKNSIGILSDQVGPAAHVGFANWELEIEQSVEFPFIGRSTASESKSP
jgi:hypothetical protein